jgi:ABC-2 type transport system permease protein
MSTARIWAMILRHLYNFKHSWDRLTDMFYWPAMDIILWGLTSAYIMREGTEVPNLIVVLLSALVFWLVVWRSQYEITVNLLEDLWSENLMNLFASPLKLSEWIGAALLLGLFKMLLSVGFAVGLVLLLYGVNILATGWPAVLFMMVLLACGWFVGLFVAGILVRFGSRLQTMAWAGVYLLAPFSAIYYPVNQLPEWAQRVASWVPMSYVFEGMRSLLFEGVMRWDWLVRAGGLTGIYIVLAAGFLGIMFRKRMEAGLSTLD